MAKAESSRTMKYVLQDFADRFPSDLERVSWVGAASFEQRCYASLTALRARKVSIDSATIIEYDTVVRPRRQSRQLVIGNRKRLRDLGGAGCSSVALPSYRFMAFLAWIEDFASGERSGTLGVVTQ